MLSAEEKHEIDHELTRYEHKSAVGLEALKIVQKYRGWVSDESIQEIADYLELPHSDLDNVATYYNLIFRKPVGRHVIMVCDSVSCWIMGYEALREKLSSRLGIKLGQTTPDNRFTLLPIVCLGTCDHAPAMMVDGDLHRDIDPEKIDQILEEYK
jgi:NADH-quinone oxidoreductase subunit E